MFSSVFYTLSVELYNSFREGMFKNWRVLHSPVYIAPTDYVLYIENHV